MVPAETCPDGITGSTCHHLDMEVEWDNASLMDEKEGFQRIWGGEMKMKDSMDRSSGSGVAG